jgi:hypothetical protein
MSPSNTFDKEVKTLTQNHKLGNKTAKYLCFSYEPKWDDHGHYARCQVKDGKNVHDATKRISVFFPPEIIVKKPLPKIETGQNLNIELIIRANPFNEKKEARPITDKVR